MDYIEFQKQAKHYKEIAEKFMRIYEDYFVGCSTTITTCYFEEDSIEIAWEISNRFNDDGSVSIPANRIDDSEAYAQELITEDKRKKLEAEANARAKREKELHEKELNERKLYEKLKLKYENIE